MERLLVDGLYRYLVSLRDTLVRCGAVDAAERVRHVSLFVSGSTSELYGETRLLLPQIAKDSGRSCRRPSESVSRRSSPGSSSSSLGSAEGKLRPRIEAAYCPNARSAPFTRPFAHRT
jgi:hypothetical protein